MNPSWMEPKMKKTIFASLLISLLSFAPQTFAQDSASLNAEPSTSPDSVQTPAAQTEIVTTVEVQQQVNDPKKQTTTTASLESVDSAATAKTEASSNCLLESNHGLDIGEALAVADILCDALREEGVTVGGAQRGLTTKPSDYFGIRVNKVGNLIVVRLSHYLPDGRFDTRQIKINDAEDITVAAARLATAIVNNTSIEGSADNSNLVHEETRVRKLAKSDFKFGLGIGSSLLLGAGSDKLAVGPEMIIQNQMEQWAIGGTLRIHIGDNFLFNVGIGGRYYFSKGEFSPFAGVNVGLLGLYAEGDGGEWGMVGRLEAGIEMFRFQQSRLGATLSADLPFFTLEENYFDGRSESVRESYAVPVSLNIYYMFN